jgi:hypothetical protein
MPMNSFSADWLALREPADHASRSATLTSTIAHVLPSAYDLAVLDLGAGTGSNVRYLSPRLEQHRRQNWLLVDHDAALLARAERELASRDALYKIETNVFDLASIANGDAKPLFIGRGLVTASALCDLVSAEWLDAVRDLCEANRTAVLFALNYDGEIECTPAHPDDEWIRDLVNVHQRRDKGLGGVALGPQAAAEIEKSFTTRGYAVKRDRSDWNLGAESGALQRALINGWVQAATEMARSDAARIHAWRRARIAHANAQTSTIRVGHEDVAAWLE